MLYNFAIFHGIYVVIVCVNAVVLCGLWYHPVQVATFIALPYFTYNMVLSRSELRGGSRWPAFSQNFFAFRAMRNHLQLSFEVSSALAAAEKKKDAQFVFAIFPHGTASDYRIAMDGMLDEIFPNLKEIRALAASVLFMIPVVRELALWTGCVDASRKVAEGVLEEGQSIIVLPGGEAEQIRTEYKKERVYLKNRKGFIKLALRKGVPIVPAYAFGVNDYYRTSKVFFQTRLWIQKTMGICIPLAIGQWGSGCCPFASKTTLVFAGPLSFELKKPGNPTIEELDEAHEKFCKSLLALFNEKKDALGYGERELLFD